MRKRSDRIKVIYNKKLLWVIIVLIILFMVLIYFIVKNNSNNKDNMQNNNLKECSVDSDCVPACGCHASTCIPVTQRGKCEIVFCTQDCSGPLDCKAGYCGCLNGKCSVVSN